MTEAPNRISGISVRGFKSIGPEQTAEIRPITVLAGANSSGKSSIMQPLLLLKQTLEASGDAGALLLNGDNVRFTRAEQILNKGAEGAFGVTIALADGQTLKLDFQRDAEKGFGLGRMVYEFGADTLVVHPAMSQKDILDVLPAPWKAMQEEVGKQENATFQWTVRRDRCFFIFELVSVDKAKRRVQFGPFGVSPSAAFVPYIQGVIHLPGLRGNPQRTYPKTAGGPSFQGTFEPYTASVIAQWQGNGRKDRLKQLATSLETMGLTWKVKAEPVDDTQVELKVGRLPHSRRGGAHDLVSIADVGFGVSQSLPVLVALLAATPGQMVYLEQPEIHLHPLAQRKLAVVLKDAVTRGVVAVVETHSAILLRELQTLVATGQLDKQDIVLHWLQRDEEGNTAITTAELDEKGAYGDWPEDFDDTELRAEQAYLDAVEAREANK